MRLKNKIILITGGSKGIGRASTELLAKQGATILFTYSSSKQEAEETVKELTEQGLRVSTIQCDVRKEEEIQALFTHIQETYGRIDVLVNNAGVLIPGPFEQTTKEAWDNTIDTNLRGVYACTKEAATMMKKKGKGKIINITSISGVVGSIASAIYAASKAGVDAITKTLAVDLGRHGITVNSIAPGPVQTNMFMESFGQEGVNKLAKETPLNRIAQPEDIAKVVLFFASEESDFVNGQVLIVDGGRIRK